MCNFWGNDCDGSHCDGECGAAGGIERQNEDGSTNSSILDLVLGTGQSGSTNNLMTSFSKGTGSALIETFGPQLIKLAKRYPKLAALAHLPIVCWFVSKYIVANMNKIWRWLMSYALASVTIKREDADFHNNVKSWILTKALFKQRRSLVAQSALFAKNGGTKIADNRPVVYTGESSFQFFKHKGKCFIYTEAQSGEITIFTVGWSPKRIQELLNEIESAREEKEEIAVFAADTKYSSPVWSRQSTTHRRTLDSVCLNPRVKSKLVEDVTDYLDEDSALWYADRGIPYRRGYLLHGRPGCGKTSLATAIAGEFKMNIYTVSLLEKSITDQVLLELFQKIPARSLVLMEDIDCAGLGRQYIETSDESGHTKSNKNRIPRSEKSDLESASDTLTSSEASQGKSSSSANEPPWQEKSKVRAKGKKKQGKNSEDRDEEGYKNKMEQKHEQEHENLEAKSPPPSQVTLSGLLNAIDGVSAPQGHILIMTSNKPELLDEALVRPGRVDVQVEFEYASHDQLKALFVKTFKPIRPEKKTSYDPDTMESLARKFADIVPAGEFSPAQIQQYLIPYRVRPQEAIDGAKQWVENNKPVDKLNSISGFSAEEDVIDLEPKVSGISRILHGGAQ